MTEALDQVSAPRWVLNILTDPKYPKPRFRVGNLVCQGHAGFCSINSNTQNPGHSQVARET